METYYTKKEYNEMKSALTKKNKALEAKVAKLTNELAEVKQDYKVLLATATEVPCEEEALHLSRN